MVEAGGERASRLSGLRRFVPTLWGANIRREACSIMRPEVSIVRESWFNAYLDGNSDWPQSNFAIELLCAEALLADPPSDWRQIAFMKMTEEMLARQKLEVTKDHRARGIRLVAEGYAREGERTIPDTRLGELFQAELVGGCLILFKLARKDPNVEEIDASDLGVLNRFLSPQEDSGHQREVRTIVSEAAAVIRSPAGMDVSLLHMGVLVGERIRGGKMPNPRAILREDGNIARFILEHTPDRDLRMGLFAFATDPTRQFRDMVFENLYASHPDFVDSSDTLNALLLNPDRPRTA